MVVDASRKARRGRGGGSLCDSDCKRGKQRWTVHILCNFALLWAHNDLADSCRRLVVSWPRTYLSLSLRATLFTRIARQSSHVWECVCVSKWVFKCVSLEKCTWCVFVHWGSPGLIACLLLKEMRRRKEKSCQQRCLLDTRNVHWNGDTLSNVTTMVCSVWSLGGGVSGLKETGRETIEGFGISKRECRRWHRVVVGAQFVQFSDSRWVDKYANGCE